MRLHKQKPYNITKLGFELYFLCTAIILKCHL